MPRYDIVTDKPAAARLIQNLPKAFSFEHHTKRTKWWLRVVERIQDYHDGNVLPRRTTSIATPKFDCTFSPEFYVSLDAKLTKSCADDLNAGFDWWCTQEGGDFWQSVYQHLIQLSQIKMHRGRPLSPAERMISR
jgi:hypothetical protein